jgi:hypothetical protein
MLASAMSEEKPTPLSDVRAGLGLLFRAARTAVEKMPTRGVEEVVWTSAREVGRALENVASTIEREVFGKRGGAARPSAKPREDPEKAAQAGDPKPPDDAA